MNQDFTLVPAKKVKLQAESVMLHMQEKHDQTVHKEIEEYMVKQNRWRAMKPFCWFFKQLTRSEAREKFLDSLPWAYTIFYEETPFSRQYEQCAVLKEKASRLDENQSILLSASDCRDLGL